MKISMQVNNKVDLGVGNPPPPRPPRPRPPWRPRRPRPYPWFPYIYPDYRETIYVTPEVEEEKAFVTIEAKNIKEFMEKNPGWKCILHSEGIYRCFPPVGEVGMTFADIVPVKGGVGQLVLPPGLMFEFLKPRGTGYEPLSPSLKAEFKEIDAYLKKESVPAVKSVKDLIDKSKIGPYGRLSSYKLLRTVNKKWPELSPTVEGQKRIAMSFLGIKNWVDASEQYAYETSVYGILKDTFKKTAEDIIKGAKAAVGAAFTLAKLVPFIIGGVVIGAGYLTYRIIKTETGKEIITQFAPLPARLTYAALARRKGSVGSVGHNQWLRNEYAINGISVTKQEFFARKPQYRLTDVYERSFSDRTYAFPEFMQTARWNRLAALEYDPKLRLWVVTGIGRR